ncbi:MAG: C10 family peptidase, partial [Prevotellaceae bacterium]|nr:C10 family peptidase [Prevotellaceae bacterium]
IDGYIHQQREVIPEAPPGMIADPYYEYRTLVHCNWGWDGYGNGYFISGSFSARIEADPGTTNITGTDYNYNNKIIITKY